MFPEDEGNLLLRPWSGSSPGQEGYQRCYLDRPGPFLCVLLDIPPSESNSQAWLCLFLLYDLSPTTVGSWWIMRLDSPALSRTQDSVEYLVFDSPSSVGVGKHKPPLGTLFLSATGLHCDIF